MGNNTKKQTNATTTNDTAIDNATTIVAENVTAASVDNTAVETIDVTKFTAQASKGTPGKKESNRNDSSYTLLGGKTTSIIEAFGLKKVSHKFSADTKKVFLSMTSLKTFPEDVLEKLSSGTAVAEGVNVKSFVENESTTSEKIHSLFYGEQSPSTKAHSFGFMVKEDGLVYFYAQQGSAVRMIEVATL